MVKKETYFTLAGIYLLFVGLIAFTGVYMGLSVYPLSVSPATYVSWFQPRSPLWLWLLLLPFYLLQTIFCIILNIVPKAPPTPVADFIVNYLPAILCIAAGVMLLSKRR